MASEIHENIVKACALYFKNKSNSFRIYLNPECELWGVNGKPDLVAVAKKDNVHVLEVEPTIKDVLKEISAHGIFQVMNYPGDKRWLALPNEEFLKAREKIIEKCSINNVGLFVTKPRGGEMYAEKILEAKQAISPHASLGRPPNTMLKKYTRLLERFIQGNDDSSKL